MRVRTLLGHAQVATAIPCLGSLLHYSAEAVELVLHDDGTLTAADRDQLLAALGPVEIVGRAEADERVADHLAARPATRAYRALHPLALKLVDVAVLAGGARLAYCDADVLFLRPFAGLFDLPNAGTDMVFMRDRQSAYSIRSWDLLRDRRLRLPARINTGVIACRAAAYDPDRVEWFLAHERYVARTPVWSEQTCWATLADPARCRVLDPAQAGFPTAPPPAPPELVALHFISPLRDRLGAWLEGAAGTEHGTTPERLTTVAVPPLSAPALFGVELRRRLARSRDE